ncbi:MAG: hypothetical protein CM1200mP20_06300 [Pseudomonadota bacterium]|nr:MAG: hypothetical protein CM1200mP20_06300 [Pseudomonadota bacterium]
MSPKAGFPDPGSRTDEALALMRKLWGPDPVDFQGRFYSVADAYFAPNRSSSPGRLSGSPATASRPCAGRPLRRCLASCQTTFPMIEQAKQTLARYLKKPVAHPTQSKSE